MLDSFTQWLPPFMLYFLVVAIRMHEIIRMLPCNTLAPRLIMLLSLPAALVSPTFGFVRTNAGTFITWALLNFAMYVVIPLWYSRGPVRARLYMVVHLSLIFLSAYLLVLALERIRTSPDPGTVSPLMDQACRMVMEIGFILVACHTTDRFAQRIIPRAGKPSFDSFLFFSALQCFMIGVAVLVISMRGVSDTWFVLLTFILSVLCLLVDVILGTIIWREHDMRAKQREADAKQIILDSYLTGSQQMLQRAEAMAQCRHDARNQLSVIRILAERGKTTQALEHIEALRANCRRNMQR
ncbi:hypothetical protein [Bifidobacterium italicum]|nr:hypothetical protein [Bifidobacterium italicum]